MNLSLFQQPPLPPCRPYQLEALDKGSEAIQAGARAVLLCMPTGTGKTRTAVEACLRHLTILPSGLIVFVAPRRELVRQATATLERAGLVIGKNALVCTIQELTMPGATIPSASLVVLDEARHYVADTWSVLRRTLTDAFFLGLDATPERGDGRGLGEVFDTLIEAISVRDAISEGYLVPYDVIRPERGLGSDLAQDPLELWLAEAKGTSTVAFCSSVKEAHTLAERFRAAGVNAEAVWGEMKTADRDRVLAAYAAGEVQVLTNMHILTEGWDAPRTETVMLASSCPTAGVYLQRVGRGGRPSPETGKTRCLVLDLVGASHDHGEPDDERKWYLEGIACRRKNAPEVRFCPICGAEGTTTKCSNPECDYEGEEMRKRRPRVLGLPMDRFARERGLPDEEKAKILAGYLRAAHARRHKPWWAFKCYEHKMGRLPTPAIKTMANRILAGK